jgi:hypothetical protein
MPIGSPYIMRTVACLIVYAGLLAALPGCIHAATPNASFAVTVTVEAGCRVSVAAIPPVSPSSSVLVTCDAGVPYSIGAETAASVMGDSNKIAAPEFGFGGDIHIPQPDGSPVRSWTLRSRSGGAENGRNHQLPAWRNSLSAGARLTGERLTDEMTVIVCF